MSTVVVGCPLEIVRGDDTTFTVTIQMEDESYLDYDAYDWSATYRYQVNSPIFFPANVFIDDELNRLEITWPHATTSIMAGSGVMDLTSIKKDDNTFRTWMVASKVKFIEDVTYVK